MTQQPLVIQPVENPIICSPYREPDAHWRYDLTTGLPERINERRPAGYWYKTEEARVHRAQLRLGLTTEENFEELPLVNALRDDVRRWRESGYENASQVTRKLLQHWWREDRSRRLFFCQLEAVETIIYIREVLAQGKTRRGKASLSAEDYRWLAQGINPRPQDWVTDFAQPPRLADTPSEAGMKPFARYACKMATGSGKTVVMAMLIAWAFCNRGRIPGATGYPRNVLIVCPNLTIKERLQVLRPENPDNYFDRFDLVPSTLRDALSQGRVLITNWHAFNPESAHAEGGRSYTVVNKGEESADAFARTRLGELYDGEPVMVLNDEGHHAYRPKPLDKDSKLSAEERAEIEEATVWVTGLDKINNSSGIAFCADMSATPFYIGGSGYPEGSPYPWIVSDFALVDAIESGITKIPRLPVFDNTGHRESDYIKLWQYITRDLRPGEKLTGGKPKSEVAYRKAEFALLTLAGQWKETFDKWQNSQLGAQRLPPVMIVVCDNTNLARHLYQQISGEEDSEDEAEIVEDADEDDESAPARGNTKERSRRRYGTGKVFPDLLSNTPGRDVTIRIDSRLLAQAESDDPNTPRKEAAEQLRKIVATVGKQGEPGEHVRCVISVNMLSEGWDANNVTNILGLRAFGSQLLCEQVVGRGLRRMDYGVDPQSGLLKPEYVDVFGVPFSLIPFKGREVGKPTGADDEPYNEVVAVDARRAYEIRFPVVEGYTMALDHNIVRCDVTRAETISVDPVANPTAVFVQPQVGYRVGAASNYGGFETQLQDRDAYYRSTHPQTIEFEIAREVVRGLTQNQTTRRAQSRSTLFPQVLRIVQDYVRTRVHNPVHPCEIGLQDYAKRIVDILLAAIEPDARHGEPPIIPILNRYKPTGSTAEVHFKTKKPVQATTHSHLNYVACDTGSWEQAAVFQLEMLAQRQIIECYARNERLECTIPYELYGYPQTYVPDFLVRIRKERMLVLEIKGRSGEDTSAKHQAARRWCSAVTNWGKLGKWDFLVCWNPQDLAQRIGEMVQASEK